MGYPYDNHEVTRLREAISRVLGRTVPSTELYSDTAEDLERYADRLQEVDRNARAYGWEIGKGHPLVEQIEETREDNPFTDPDWRSKIVVPEQS